MCSKIYTRRFFKSTQKHTFSAATHHTFLYAIFCAAIRLYQTQNPIALIHTHTAYSANKAANGYLGNASDACTCRVFIFRCRPSQGRGQRGGLMKKRLRCVKRRGIYTRKKMGTPTLELRNLIAGAGNLILDDTTFFLNQIISARIDLARCYCSGGVIQFRRLLLRQEKVSLLLCCARALIKSEADGNRESFRDQFSLIENRYFLVYLINVYL